MARYDAFLLRIWHSGDAAGAQWSIRLQHLPDGQVARLGDLDGLAAYLQAVLYVDATRPEAPPGIEQTAEQ
ncbi:MAG TPA: hypothetical protein VHB98_06325 [Chloroflexota bacterium]|nr:hypothetical protein [Chloroflexota bacterium]